MTTDTAPLRLTTLAALLAAVATTIVDRDVPGLGTVRVKQLTVTEYDLVRTKVRAADAKSDFGLAMVAAAVVDDAGAPLFASIDDLEPLRQGRGGLIDPLIGAVLEVQGFRRADSPNSPA